MKSFNTLSLALLLSMPALHAGCDGYEPSSRSEGLLATNVAIYTGATTMILGAKAILYGVDDIVKQGERNPRFIFDRAESIKGGLLMITAGACLSFYGLTTLASNESTARSNCCNFLPANTTCDWNK